MELDLAYHESVLLPSRVSQVVVGPEFQSSWVPKECIMIGGHVDAMIRQRFAHLIVGGLGPVPVGRVFGWRTVSLH